MKRYIKNKLLYNNKGSSLITVLMVTLVLTIIGISILSTTSNNLHLSITMANSEQAYYLAESGAIEAIDFIKEEVSDYYMQMYNSANQSSCVALHNVFYQQIGSSILTSSATCDFSEPDFSNSNINATTATTITSASDLSTNPSGPVIFEVSSTVDIGNASRTVVGTITVDKPAILWIDSSVPIITDAVLLAVGDDGSGNITDSVNVDFQGGENNFVVNGLVRLAGTFTDGFGINSSNGPIFPDPTVIEDVDWHLSFDAFSPHYTMPALSALSSIDMEQTVKKPKPNKTPPQIKATKDYSFKKDTIITDEILEDIDIYCDKDLTFINTQLINCHINAKGDVTFRDDSWTNEFNIIDTTIYSNGILSIECNEIRNNTYHYLYGKSSIDIKMSVGTWGSSEGTLQNIAIYSPGNVYITSESSLFSSNSDSIINSYIYADGSLVLGETWGIPTIDNISNSLLRSGGNMQLRSGTMQSYSKVYAGGNLEISSSNTDTCELYTNNDMTFDVSGLAALLNLFKGSRTNNCIYVARDNVDFKLAGLTNSYIYAGNRAVFNFDWDSSFKSFGSNIVYAENYIRYINDSSSIADIVESSLLYTNGDFQFGGTGSDPNGSFSTGFAGLQLMVGGQVSSYEDDDSGSSNEDIMGIGHTSGVEENGPYDKLQIQKIHELIGDYGPAQDGSMAQAVNLYDHHFEQELPQDEIKKILPFYEDVFSNEDVHELNID